MNLDLQKATKLADDQEFVLKYQAVALAKYHNLYGGIDQYIKEFARLVIEMGDK